MTGNQHQWLSMSEAAKFTPYNAEYLSLLARKRKLPAKKIGKNWFTTKNAVEEYMRRQMIKTHIQNGGTEIISQIKEPSQNEPQNEFLNELNFIREKLAHGLARKIIEEKKLEIGPAFAEEVKKFSESLSGSLGGLSKQVETIASLKREKIIQEQKISAGEEIYVNTLFGRFISKFNNFLDISVEGHFGLFHRVWRFIKKSFGIIFSRPTAFLIFLVLLALLMIFPFRFVFGFFDDAFHYAVNKMEDAQTVLGFRPGTHENEILLLDKRGNISILGNIETEGQFQSFVKEGTAPIMVESTTKVENLNADYLDNLHAEEFTLAYVTKNGNVTTEDVYLDGKVEVGKILLVKGVTKLLSTLEVDGELLSFGGARFKKSVIVDGPAYFNALLNAKDINATGMITGNIINGVLVSGPTIIASQSLSSEGNFRVTGQSIFGGFAFFNSGIQAQTGDFELSLGVGGDFSASGNVRLGKKNKEASVTSKNWNITIAGAADFTSLDVSGEASISQLSLSKASTTQLSVSNYFWSNGTTTIGDEISDALIINAGDWTLASSTATTTVAMTSGLNFDNGTFLIDPYSNFIGIGTTSSFTELSVEGSGYFTGTLIAAGGFTASSSVSAPYFTATDANATSTFAGGFSVGGNTTLGNATTSDIVFLNSKIAGSLIPTQDNVLDLGDETNWLRWRTGYFGTSVGIGGTATSTGTQLLTSGAYLIDSDGTLSINTTNNQPVSFGIGNVSIPYASTTNISSTGGAWFATTAGNVGIATTSPWKKLSVSGDMSLTGALYDSAASAGSDGYVLKSTGSATEWVATSTLFTVGTDILPTGTEGQMLYNNAGLWTAFSGMYWDDSNSRLGIGTTSPYSLLSISNSASTAANTPLFTIASTTAGAATSTLMTVLANGNVGIGTAYAFRKLNVSNTSGADLQIMTYVDTIGETARLSFRVEADDSDVRQKAGIWFERTDTSGRGTLHFINNGGDNNNNAALTDSKVAITYSGLVGIGTTSPSTLLELYSGAANGNPTLTFSGGTGSGSNVGQISFYSIAGTSEVAKIQTVRDGGNTQGALTFYTAHAGAIAERMRITEGGNVGIGETSPAYKLEIKGTGAVGGLAFDTGVGHYNLYGDDTTGLITDQGLKIGDGSIGLKIGADTQIIRHDSNVLRTYDSFIVDGNVGIGTTSPGAKLHIYGASGTGEVIQWIGTGEDATGRLKISYDTTNKRANLTSWGSDGWKDLRIDGNNLLLQTQSSGNVGIGTTTPNWKLQVAATRPFLTLSDTSAGTDSKHWFLSSQGGNLYVGTSTDVLNATTTYLSILGSTGKVAIGDGATGVPSLTFIADTTSGLRRYGAGLGFVGGSVDLAYLDSTSFRTGSSGNRPSMRIGASATSTPGFFFSTDTDTGLHNDGMNDLSLVTGGTSRLYVNSSGNVGIGTTSPQGTLTVHSGQITGASGGVSAPTYSFNDDLNTGIYSGSADALRFVIGGSYVMRMISAAVDAGGNANSWSLKLDSVSTSSPPYSFFNDGDTGIYHPLADTIGFVTGTAERVRIDSTGNVGIGTASPNYKTDIYTATNGSITNNLLLVNRANGIIGSGASLKLGTHVSGVYGVRIRSESTQIDPTFPNDKLVISTNYNSATESDRFTILANGNVGIGTTTPASKLDVQGRISQVGSTAITGYLMTNSSQLASATNLNPGILVFGGDGSNSTYGIDLGYNGAYLTRFLTGGSANGFAFGYTGSNPSSQSNWTELVRITGTGYVGIGTTSPTTKFSVGGNAGDTTGHGYFSGGLGVGIATTTSGVLETLGNVYVGGALTVVGSLTSSITNGQIQFLAVPTGTNIYEGGVYINPSSAGTNNVLLGLAVNGAEKARIDAEGDVQIVGVFNSTNSERTTQLSGGLNILASTTLGSDSSDTVTFNAKVNSAILPASDLTYDLGSADFKWANLYVGTTTIETLVAGGTASSTFIINTDNATDDEEDATLEFERGIATPNAILRWDSANDQFNFNYPISTNGSVLGQGTATSSFAGPVWFTATPLGTSHQDATVYINPSSGGGDDYILFAIDVGGSERFQVDQEGDTLIHASLGVENQIYDISQDTLTINDSLQIMGNNIKDSGSNARLTIGATNTITGNLTTTGNFVAQGYGSHYFENGSVGIGTTTPSSILHVVSITSPQFTLGYNGQNYSTFGIGSDGALTITPTNNATTTIANGLVVNTDNLVVQKASGIVGIGTTDPFSTLEVVGTSTTGTVLRLSSAGTGAVDNSSALEFNYAGDAAGTRGNLARIMAVTQSGGGGDLLFQTAPSIYGSYDTKMILQRGGNFGVGTTSPLSLFSVGTAGNAFRVDNTGTVKEGIWNGTSIGDTYIDNNITISGGTIGSNNISSGAVWTTLGTLTIGDGGDRIDIASNTWDVTDGVISGATGLSSSGTITFSDLTANRLVATDGSSNLVNSISSANLALSVTDETGTAGSLVFSASPTLTGLLAFANATGTRLTITNDTYLATSGGSVGIGTTTPTTKFSVGGNAGDTTGHGYFSGGLGVGILNTTAGTLRTSGNATIGGILTVNTTGSTFSGNVTIPYASTTQLTVTGNAYLATTGDTLVGIGTTDPFSTLEVVGTSTTGTVLRLSSAGTGAVDNSSALEFNYAGDAAGTRGNLARIMAVTQSGGGGDLLFQTAPSIYGSYDTKMILQRGGNVGIGTTSPAAKLHVSGASPTLRIDGLGAGEYWDWAGGTNTIALKDWYGISRIKADGVTGNVLLNPTSGNVGIGTTSPQGTLTVHSGQITGASGGVSAPTYSFNDDLNTGIYSGSADALRFVIGGSYVMRMISGVVDSGGNANSWSLKLDSVSTSSPPYSFFGDGDTGIYHPMANTIGFVTNAGEKVRIDSSGNVGVGTTSPGSKLHLYDSGASAVKLTLENSEGNAGIWTDANDLYFFTGIYERWRIDNSGSVLIGGAGVAKGAYIRGEAGSVSTPTYSFNDDSNTGIYSPSAGEIRVSIDNSDKVTIDSSGNVGVGTTSPNHKLEVYGGNLAVSASNVDHGRTFYLPSDTFFRVEQVSAGVGGAFVTGATDGGAYSGLNLFGIFGATDPTDNVPAVLITGAKSNGGTSGVALGALETVFQVETGGSVGAGTKLLTILGSGNVGIGTTSPQALLHVYGTTPELILDRSSGSIGSYVSLAQNGSKKAYIGISGAIDGIIGGSVSGDMVLRSEYQNILFSTNGGSSASMYIQNATGNVGIGTTTPNNKLDIYSTTKSAIGFSGASGDTYKWTIGMDISNGGIFSIASSTALGTTDRFVINGNGNVGIGATVPETKLHVAGGDIRLTYGASQQAIDLSQTSTGGVINIRDSSEITKINLDARDANNPSFFNAGNVGIGTTSPSQKLSVQGNLLVSGNISSIANLTATGTISAANFVATSASATSTFAGGLAIETSGFVYDYSTNKVGIGTTNPAVSLHVEGEGRFNGQILASKFGDLSDSSYYVDPRGDTSAILYGNVGIGTTSPSGRLAVRGAGTGAEFLSYMEDSGGTARFVIQDNGSVGIGTASPAYPLQVVATSTSGTMTVLKLASGGSGAVGDSPGLEFAYAGGSTPGNLARILGYVQSGGGGDILFQTAPSQTGSYDTKMILQRGGNVGIGTTSPASLLTVGSSMDTNFRVNSSGIVLATTTLGTALRIGSTGSGEVGNGPGLEFVYGTDATPGNLARILGYVQSGGGGDILFQTAPSQTGSYDTKMILQRGGNVGIGTTSPNNVLDIYSTTKSAIGFSGASGDTYKWTIGMDISNGGRFSIASSTALGTTDRFVINGNGNVGIGTTSPSQKLSVQGNLIVSGNISSIANLTATGTISAANFVATSASATSTFAGGLAIETSGFVYDYSTNNVGIGTTDPAFKLTIVNLDTSNNYSAFNVNNNDPGSTYSAYITGSSYFAIKYNGNVGIGTTDPQKALHIDTGSVNNNFILHSGASSAQANTLLESLGTYNFSLGISVNDLYFFYTDSSNVARQLVYTGGAIDLAEWYKVGSNNLNDNGNSTLIKGNILCIDSSEKRKVVACDSAYDQKIAGIVSTKSYTTMGMNDLDDDHHDAAELSLVGQVPAIVTAQNGSISIGDLITSSDIRGVGMKAIRAGFIVGKALESTSNWNESACPAVSSLNAIEWPEDDGTNSASPCFRLPDDTYVGKIMVFVNPHWWDGDIFKNHLFVDVSGNVGIGTTTPTHKLEVAGEIAAEAFINISTSEAKKDIIYIKKENEEDILKKITSTELATYYYNDEDTSGNRRLGLIAEQAPTEVLSADAKGVDLYKMTSFVWGGLKALSNKVDNLFSENYKSNGGQMEIGDIVSLTSLQYVRIEKATSSGMAIGVVSPPTGDLPQGDNPDFSVAFSGKQLVKVSLENGEIKAGDRIALSSVPGVGEKATSSGQTIGIALENFSGNTATSTDGSIIYDKNAVGKISVFINLGYSKLDKQIAGGVVELDGEGESSFWGIDESSGRIKFIGALDINDFDIINVKAIYGSAGKWSIDQNGKFTAQEVETNKLVAKENVQIGTKEKPIGMTIYQMGSGEPICVYAEGGVLKTIPGECGQEAPTGSGGLNTADALTLPDNNSVATTTTDTTSETATTTPMSTESGAETPTESDGATTTTATILPEITPTEPTATSTEPTITTEPASIIEPIATTTAAIIEPSVTP